MPRSRHTDRPLLPGTGRPRHRPATTGGRRPRRSPLPLYLLGRLLALAVWTTAAWVSVVELPPLPGTVLVLGLTAALLWWYALRPGRSRERATLRLRAPRGAGPWLLATLPVWILFNLSAVMVHARWAGAPPDSAGTLDEFARQPLAWLPLLVLAVVFAPLSEEIFFRGFVQRTVERRLGAVPGILTGAGLFAAFHCEPWRMGYLVAGGIAFGAFVHAARSLWAGVGLHAAANGSVALLDAGAWDSAAPGDHPLSPSGEILLLLGSLALLIRLYQRVQRSARGEALPDRPGQRSSPEEAPVPLVSRFGRPMT